jgi:multiple sugar transport system permease protein
MYTKRQNIRHGLLFSLPFLIVYGWFLIFPIAYGFIISFHKWDILSQRVFVGFRNYLELFQDEKFYTSLWHTIEFVLLTTPTIIVVGFFMALIVTSRFPLRKTAENCFFLPYIFSITVVASLWAWLFQKSYGLFNQVWSALGGQSIGWLTDERFAMKSIALTTLWWTAGFNMVLFSAGIKQIPDALHESAYIDGANKVQVLFRITIPLLRPTIILVFILQVIASFKVFGQVYVMTGGGPYGATRVLIQYIYEAGFRYYTMGYASAMAYVLFIIILLVSLFQFRVLSGKGK